MTSINDFIFSFLGPFPRNVSRQSNLKTSRYFTFYISTGCLTMFPIIKFMWISDEGNLLTLQKLFKLSHAISVYLYVCLKTSCKNSKIFHNKRIDDFWNVYTSTHIYICMCFFGSPLRIMRCYLNGINYTFLFWCLWRVKPHNTHRRVHHVEHISIVSTNDVFVFIKLIFKRLKYHLFSFLHEYTSLYNVKKYVSNNHICMNNECWPFSI